MVAVRVQAVGTCLFRRRHFRVIQGSRLIHVTSESRSNHLVGTKKRILCERKRFYNASGDMSPNVFTPAALGALGGPSPSTADIVSAVS